MSVVCHAMSVGFRLMSIGWHPMSLGFRSIFVCHGVSIVGVFFVIVDMPFLLVSI